MIEFKESKFYKLLQDFSLNNDKETFLQLLAEFYNRTEGIIEKNVNQDDLIKELRELYLEFNEKGIDENIVIEKVNYFVENNVKIKDILAKLVINTNKIEDNTEKLNANTNNIENITSQLDTMMSNNLFVSVKDFGAIGDGVNDDTKAFKSAIEYVFKENKRYPSRTVYIPSGTYRITENGVFSANTSNLRYKHGIRFIGDGLYNSTILLENKTETDMYFYDNSDRPTFSFCIFEGLQFTGRIEELTSSDDIPANVNGFKINSSGNEQGFRFINCLFQRLNKAFIFTGVDTASEMKFIGCKIAQIKNDVYTINNAQSVNHEFISSDIEQVYSNVFKVDNGGSIKVFGGSIILFSKDVHSYVFNINNSSSVSGECTLNGCRVELRGDLTGIANINNLNYGLINFNECTFLDGYTTTTKYYIKIGAYSTINMNNCEFNHNNGIFRVFPTTNGTYGNNGVLNINNSRLATSSPHLKFEVGNGGRISLDNCYGPEGAIPDNGGLFYNILNQDYFGTTNRGTGQNYTQLKIKNALIPLGYFPYSVDGDEIFLQTKFNLPLFSTIKSITIIKQENTPYDVKVNWLVKNEEGTEIIRTDDVNFGDTLNFTKDNLFIDVLNENQRKLIFSIDTKGSVVNYIFTKGYILIEYI